MIVKICGIKDLAAMDAALEAGADMVGLVFFGNSPRNVTPAEASSLAARARGKAKVVALSVDADDKLIDAIEASIAPDLHQLHGSETPARVNELRVRTKRAVMKAIPVATASDLAPLVAYEEVCDWILFDAKAPKAATRPGGHGQTFDWALLKNVKHAKPAMLSGGINPANAPDYFQMPSVAAIGGTWIAEAKLIKEKKWAEITRNAREIVEIAAKYRT